MSSAAQPATIRDPATRWLTAGVLLGSIIAVLGLPFASASEYREMGAMVGVSTVLGGVVQHVLAVLVIFVLFAGVVSGTRLRRYAESRRTLAVIGMVYGAVVPWGLYDTFVFPFWLQAVGGASSPIPAVDLTFLPVQLAFGAVYGVLYYYILHWLRDREPTGAERDRMKSEPSA